MIVFIFEFVARFCIDLMTLATNGSWTKKNCTKNKHKWVRKYACCVWLETAIKCGMAVKKTASLKENENYF